MFLCKRCHEDEQFGQYDHPFTSHVFGSEGLCESCSEVQLCVDCREYRHIRELKERVNG